MIGVIRDANSNKGKNMRSRRIKNGKAIMLSSLTATFLISCWAAPRINAAEIANLDSLGRVIESGTWQERNAAAKTISSAPIADTSQAIGILVNAIESELKNPVSPDRVGRRFRLSITGFLKREYTATLLKISPKPSSYLHAFVDTAQGVIREWVVTRVMAAQGDESVHPEVRVMAQEARDQEKRFWAIEGLSAYKDTNDVAIFEKALSDGWRVVDTIPDVYLEDGSPAASPGYPIRSVAIKALRQLGYLIGTNEQGLYMYKEEK